MMEIWKCKGDWCETEIMGYEKIARNKILEALKVIG